MPDTVTGNIISEYNSDTASQGAISGKIKEIWIVKETNDQFWYFDCEIVSNQIILKDQYNNPYIDSIFYELSIKTLPGLGLTATLFV